MVFDSSLRKELSRSFGATLVVILTIAMTMFLIRTLRQAANGVVAPQDVVLFLGLVVLGYLPALLSLSLFVAVVVTLGRMYRDSEVVIWLASGVSVMRFVRPVLRMSWPVLLVIVGLLAFAWPWGNQQTQSLRDRFQQRSDLSRVTPGVFQSSSDGSRVFFVERAGVESGLESGTARNVFILTRNAKGESVTSARNGHLETVGNDRVLVLDRGQRNEIASPKFEKSLARFETYRVVVEERMVPTAATQPPRATPTHALIASGTPAAHGELAWRVGLMLAAFNLLLLGVGLAASNPRRPSNWNLLFALLAFIVYFNMITVSQGWVAGGRLSLPAALVGLHGCMFAVAMALLWWRDHGTVLRLMPQRRAAA